MSHETSTLPGEPLYSPEACSTVERKEMGFTNTTSPGSNETQTQDTVGKERSDDLLSWDDFTQSTTFHGVRYIFQRNHFKVRRLEIALFSLSFRYKPHYVKYKRTSLIDLISINQEMVEIIFRRGCCNIYQNEVAGR